MKTCLILVDIQNDFCPGGSLAVPLGDEVVSIANRIQPCFDLVVATQDWHPAEHGSFACNHPGRSPFEMGELAGLAQVLWPAHCVQDTLGAAFHPALDLTRIAKVFPKGTDPKIDSYSGFFDNGKLRATGLGDWLKEAAVTEVFVCGLATDYCVKATAIDAAQLGLKTTLLADACRGVGLGVSDIPEAIQAMRNAGVVISDNAALARNRT
jgi:nicotinamidase/pyrazinamidase